MALTIFFIFCMKVPYYKGKKRSQAFFRKNSRSRDIQPYSPKMAQNGPKMVVNQKFLENGSNDFPDFWPEVGGQYLKKVDPARVFSKNPILLDLGLQSQNGPKIHFLRFWRILSYDPSYDGSYEKIDETGFRSFWPKLGPLSAPFSPKNENFISCQLSLSSW